jgi:hypothetical protein
MNAIQIANLIDTYLDVTRSARFQRQEYDNATDNAIRNYIDNILNDYLPNKNISFQSEQVISDDLYTLQKTQTAAPTADVALFPADYYFLTSLFVTIGGVTTYCRPTNQNELGPLLEDTFRKPSDAKPYYLQGLTGFKIYHGTGTITSAALNYLKKPNTFTIGTDAQLITAGGTLAIGSSYIAVDVSVENSITYAIGTQFLAGTTALTSGTVILASNTVTVELPEKTHPQIAKMAAEILSGVTQDYNRSAFSEKQANKS